MLMLYCSTVFFPHSRINEFNKAWRVSDSARRLIYNLLRSPPGLWEALKICYNESKPQDAGFGLLSVSRYLCSKIPPSCEITSGRFDSKKHVISMIIMKDNVLKENNCQVFSISSQSLTLSALTMDNMEGDYFVVGNELVDGDDLWKEIQAMFFG